MSRTVYVNGNYCAPEKATVSVFDRGFNFADGVYEVVAVMDGKLVDFDGHMRRLRRSLGELDIPEPLTEEELLTIHRELVSSNDLDEGLVYMQITRGVAERDFVIPEGLTPTVVLFTQEKPLVENKASREGIKLKSMPDLRWERRDIKSVGLLAQVMAKQAAKEAGAYEAIMTKDGYVTEGGSSSTFIVKDNMVITRPLSNAILAGITRASLLDLVTQTDVVIDERNYTLEEAYDADEAFITAASTYVCPVIAIDDRPIGDGSIGPVVRKFQQIYIDNARATAV